MVTSGWISQTFQFSGRPLLLRCLPGRLPFLWTGCVHEPRGPVGIVSVWAPVSILVVLVPVPGIPLHIYIYHNPLDMGFRFRCLAERLCWACGQYVAGDPLHAGCSSMIVCLHCVGKSCCHHGAHNPCLCSLEEKAWKPNSIYFSTALPRTAAPQDRTKKCQF